ncbi:Predicted oxidoreductase, contains short-chain dehydrogenase (SDR) and DUF2520 domains [Ekhidna lutea]|uniref:Predicted oxidoreductase, contains short-chain dehydrogenase (SDR) and DUF2520 domains n=1 Tax=Ekhidna lutea TaxID=447679 RepID=A0A239FGC1_EKHLU|nr:Rossmann-like and DUF2520 domain-containing protein [Ekhidna lutea]SNS55212.1 Predicted oxidoreductase, contains short-chain dehydrogenase (SDR) and DUF2520 domains [Ekhidna lutea]
MSKVAIIGYGNVGYHLAKRISSKRHEVTIFSRTQSEDFILSIDQLNPEAFDFIILSVPDGDVKSVSDSIATSEAVMLHTSGANPISDLSKHLKHGVMYPLQTFSRTKDIDFTAFPVFVEGSDEGEKDIFTFVRSFSNDVRLLTSANRSKLHLAAVFACNFSNHMFHLSEKLLADLDMTFKDIQPLVEETVRKAMELDPSASQTGPAMREDEETINSHLEMLKDEQLKNIYRLITESIQNSK